MRFKRLLQKADNETCTEYSVPSESVASFRSMYGTGKKSSTFIHGLLCLCLFIQLIYLIRPRIGNLVLNINPWRTYVYFYIHPHKMGNNHSCLTYFVRCSTGEIERER